MPRRSRRTADRTVRADAVPDEDLARGRAGRPSGSGRNVDQFARVTTGRDGNRKIPRGLVPLLRKPAGQVKYREQRSAGDGPGREVRLISDYGDHLVTDERG